MSIVAVGNRKGGVGKTSVTVNLAHALALEGRKVLVLDVDGQSNASRLLMRRASVAVHSLADYLDPFRPLDELTPLYAAAIPARPENVWILPNGDTALLEPRIIEHRGVGSMTRLSEALNEETRSRFDHIFLDLPPNLGALTVQGVFAADFVMVPVDLGSALSVEGLIKMVDLIADMQSKMKSSVQFLKIIANKYDGRKSVCKKNQRDLAGVFQKRGMIFETVLPTASTIQNAENRGCTVFSCRNNTKITMALSRLACEFEHTIRQRLSPCESVA